MRVRVRMGARLAVSSTAYMSNIRCSEGPARQRLSCR